ncbi:MAG: choice-of-anchor D domain-containing protein, partial [Candidatus Krumholzibacteriia bacterium]
DLPRVIRNAAFWASAGGDEICWVDAAPSTGVVPPLGSTEVNVTFHPTSLCAPSGSFRDTLVVSSNDPDGIDVLVPLRLVVAAAPDIAVGDSLLDFGSVLIGNTESRAFIVANYGATSLSVSSVSIDNPVLTTNGSGFSLAINEEREIAVVFEPLAAGVIEGTLTIASSDPDEPVVAVALRGEALLPPVVTVSPDSLSASLVRGDSLVRAIVIGNEGASDLEWSIYPLSGSSLRAYTLPPAPIVEAKPSPDEGVIAELAEDVRVSSGELAAALMDLGGVRVLYDYSHNQYSDTYWWRLIIADLTARGATVTMNRSPITPAILDGVDVFWTTDVQTPFSESEITALRDWVEAGGGLLFEGDQSSDAFNAILAALRTGIEYSPVAGAKGVTTAVFPHVITRDVSSVLLYNNIAHLSSVAYPARLLLDDKAGIANAAISVAGMGSIVAFADEPFADDYIISEDNRLLGNQVMDYLVFGANWLNPVPLEGTVAAAETAQVDVTIDPRGLHGGEYDARLQITSNDPSTPEVMVPVHVSVTGVPALALSDTTLDFGQVLIGATERRELIVTNAGSDILVVKKIAVEGAGYAADSTGFSLPVHGADTLIVTLLPESEGTMPGMLTIYSNDPADTARAIELAGEGLIPPEIVVTPGALSDSLFTGESSTHILTIENPGENELVFALIENGSGNRILIMKSGSEVSVMRTALAGFADVSAVDVFDGGAATPTLDYLMGYRCVIVASGMPFADPGAVGNVLADYVDRGGGVILTVPSFVSGMSLQGRFMSGGYSPFTIGTGLAPNATLGSYDAGHPVMAGIASMQSLLYTTTSLAAGADWVAQWSNGVPFVATMGERVVGANIFIIDSGTFWPGPNAGVIALLLHNAMLWMSGGNVCWMSAQPTAGSIAPHSSAEIAVTFAAGRPVCVTEGRYLDTLVVESNVPSKPRVEVPLDLFVTSVSDIAAADSVPDFGPVLLGMSVVDTLVVSNTGWDTLVVSAITIDNPSFSAGTGAFSLAPLGSQDLFVHFAPVDTGLVHGILTIESNDPDEASVPVALSGTGRSNVALVSPLGGEEWCIGETDTIRWIVSGPAPDSVSVFLSRDGGVSYLDTLAMGLAGTTLYSWVVAPPETPSARIMIRSYRGVAVSGYDASDSLFAIVTVTGVDEDDDAPPAVNFLAQNYPNPLNPSTRIDFSLRESAPVSLRIYDATGRLVRVLLDEPRKAGRYSEDWDGRDSRGRSVASGVYYCRLVSGSFTATRKMILLR